MVTPDVLRATTLKAIARIHEIVRSHPEFPLTRRMQRWARWKLDSKGGSSGEYLERDIHAFPLWDLTPDWKAEIEDASNELLALIMEVRKVMAEEAKNIFWRFIGDLFAELPSDPGEFAASIERRYADFEANLLLPIDRVILRAIAAVRGLFLESEQLALPDGLILRKCDDDLLRQFQRAGDVYPLPSNMADPATEGAAYALEYKTEVQFRGAFPPENSFWPFHRFAVYGRLYAPSPFYICKISCPCPYGLPFVGILFSPPPFGPEGPMHFFPSGPPLSISKADEAGFIEGYRRFCDFCDKPPLPLFLRWFAKGCYEEDPADKILDLMVALGCV